MYHKGESSAGILALLALVVLAGFAIWSHTPTEAEKKYAQVIEEKAPAATPDLAGSILTQTGTVNYDIVTLPTGERVIVFTRSVTLQPLSTLLLPPLEKGLEK